MGAPTRPSRREFEPSRPTDFCSSPQTPISLAFALLVPRFAARSCHRRLHRKRAPPSTPDPRTANAQTRNGPRGACTPPTLRPLPTLVASALTEASVARQMRPVPATAAAPRERSPPPPRLASTTRTRLPTSWAETATPTATAGTDFALARGLTRRRGGTLEENCPSRDGDAASTPADRPGTHPTRSRSVTRGAVSDQQTRVDGAMSA